MHHDFIDDLLEALKRVIKPDSDLLRDLLIFNGMPEKSQNLRYLSYNRQSEYEGSHALVFSAAAVINNRRTAQWRLTGYREKISQIVFNPRWTRSPLDLFLVRLRCRPEVMDILTTVSAHYTLMGILQIEDRRSGGTPRRKRYRLRPVVAVPGIDDTALSKIVAFEKANEIERNCV
ncbi:MAG: hypothetical protein JJV98_11205 [Desulfosarcina sp.]|nr:hypothetical protein [Desulfobacterales bacterium]